MNPHQPIATGTRRRPGDTTSFGAELRRERELRGIPLREVAEATKVNLRFLEALEQNDFSAVPGGLFTRGFIRAYANHIGADADKLLNAYLLQMAEEERQATDENRPLGPRLETAAETEPAGRRRWLWGVLFVAGALLIWGIVHVLLRFGTPA